MKSTFSTELPTTELQLRVLRHIGVYCFKHHEQPLVINCTDDFDESTNIYIEPCWECMDALER